MHISEGILPLPWAAATTALAVPFVAAGARQVTRNARREPGERPLLGLIGAAIFVVSSLPIPVPIAGTSAHPTGVGMGAIFLRPLPTTAVVAVVLLIQALVMAHGGLTTWGANTLNMGVIGPFAAYALFWLVRRARAPLWLAAAAAGVAADLATYGGTALVMGWALHGERSPVTVSLAIFASFLPTQIPLAILEAIVTAIMLQFVLTRRPDILRRLRILRTRQEKSRAT